MSKTYSTDFCEFCYEIDNGIIGENSKLYKQLKEKFDKSRVILKTNNWIVMPTVGCFMEGYVLAVSKSHFLSLHECNLDSKREFAVLNKTIQQIFKEVYQSEMVYFEHGTIQREYSSCSAEHAHLHFIPMQNSIWNKYVSQYNPNYYEIGDINQLSNIIKDKNLSSYLLFRDVDGKIYVVVPDKTKYPSQFFRMFISEYMGMSDNRNWRRHYHIDNMYSTYSRIKDYLKENHICTFL